MQKVGYRIVVCKQAHYIGYKPLFYMVYAVNNNTIKEKNPTVREYPCRYLCVVESHNQPVKKNLAMQTGTFHRVPNH